MRWKESKNRCGYGKDNRPDYDEACATFTWEQVEREMALPPDGQWNIAAEAVDRQAGGQGRNKAAFRFYDGNSGQSLTYLQLRLLTNRFANVLTGLGLRPGERVALFLPAAPEFYITFLGIVKAGAIAVPLFTTLMADAMTELLRDSDAAVVVTTARLVDRIERDKLPALRHVILVGEDDGPSGDTVAYRAAMAEASDFFRLHPAGRETPMLLLYTSGSTGKPKGVVHVHGGITHYYQTARYVLDLHGSDVYWCTAEPGWVAGISYGVWAPLLAGVTSVVFCGAFNARQWYEVLSRYRVNVWYTTPTALRRLMNFGPAQPAQRWDLKGLRHILTVGEPLNPSVTRWCFETLGQAVYDTWWMTETGGVLIANFRGMPVKPGSMGRPIPGIYASVIDEQGHELPPLEMGQLAVRAGWPAMMRDIWKDGDKFRKYFRLPPWYLTGDLAYRDADGYFWFQGRVDDVIKKDGKRIGPFEVENKLVEHPAVLEAGVIGKPDALWGEVIKAFVVLHPAHQWSEELQAELQEFIERRLGSHLVPCEFEPCPALPRTRSGKIIRRVLKAMELGLPCDDLFTVDD